MLHREESEMSTEFSPATLHLMEEHERFRAKMMYWKKALDDLGEQERLRTLHEIVEFLDRDIELHARKEDEAYFPALEPYHSTVLMYEAHELIREETTSFKTALRAWEKGEVDYSKVRSSLERVFTLLQDHFGEEELVYFPVAEEKLSEAEKAEVWGKMQEIINCQGGASR